MENLKENVSAPCPMGEKANDMTRTVVTNPNGANPAEVGSLFNRAIEDEADVTTHSEVCIDNMKSKTIKQ